MVLAVILKILSIIGWILLGILGLIVLLLLIVCLVPIRYRADVHAPGTLDGLKAQARATWLLHLISADAGFEERSLTGRIRIAWKKINLTEDEADFQDTSKDKKEKDTAAEPEKEEAEEGSFEVIVENKKEEEEKDKKDSAPVSVVTAEKKETAPPEESAPEEKSREEKKAEKKEARAEKKRAKEEKKETKKTTEKKHRFTIDRIYDTINEIRFTWHDVMGFLEKPVHQKALAHVKKRLVKFLKKLLPRKLKAEGVIGFEDPYNTARAATLMSFLARKTGDSTAIDFDFENSVFEVDGYLKGIIRLGSAVWMILPLLVDIRIWRTIKDIKAFKKKIDHSKEVITKGGQAA